MGKRKKHHPKPSNPPVSLYEFNAQLKAKAADHTQDELARANEEALAAQFNALVAEDIRALYHETHSAEEACSTQEALIQTEPDSDSLYSEEGEPLLSHTTTQTHSRATQTETKPTPSLRQYQGASDVLTRLNSVPTEQNARAKEIQTQFKKQQARVGFFRKQSEDANKKADDAPQVTPSFVK